MSRQPDRSRSRRVVLAVALFLTVLVLDSDEDCASPTGALATLTLLPRLMGALGRGLVLVSLPEKEIQVACPPPR